LENITQTPFSGSKLTGLLSQSYEETVLPDWRSQWLRHPGSPSPPTGLATAGFGFWRVAGEAASPQPGTGRGNEAAPGAVSDVPADDSYELRTTSTVRRALSETLPEAVAAAAHEFITGPLLTDPHRITATSGCGGDMTNHPGQLAPQPDVMPGPTCLGGRGHR
jgi:hypothetical protein